MQIGIEIECDTIQEFWAHLQSLSKQIKKSARKQKLNPLNEAFAKEDADSLYDDNCYGTHTVFIRDDEDDRAELFLEAAELVIKLLPSEQFGESYEAERLWHILEKLSDYRIEQATK